MDNKKPADPIFWYKVIILLLIAAAAAIGMYINK